MTVLVVTLFLLVFQVGAALHTRNVMVASAAEGARFGANADRSPQEGAERATEVLAEALGRKVADRLPCAGTEVLRDGNRVVEVTCHGQLPLVLLPTPAELLRISVSGHAYEEAP